MTLSTQTDSSSRRRAPGAPSTIFLDGSFRLPDGGYAACVGVAGGSIVATGSVSEVRESMPAGSDVVEIGGGAAFPGFCDAHVHFLNFGRSRMGASCWPDEVASVREIVDRVRVVEAKVPASRWVRGRGFDPSRTEERRAPSAQELDLPSGRPVVLDSFDFHRRVANHAALSAAGIEAGTPDPPGGRIVRAGDGLPTGELLDAARGLIDKVMPPWSDEEDREAFLRTSEHFARAGFTHVINAAPLGMQSPGEEVRAFTRASADGRSLVRVSTMVGPDLFEHVKALGLPLGFGNEMVRLNGVKIFSDGAFGARTACMHEHYEDGPALGHLSIEEDDLARVVAEVAEAGWRACVHAIGDRAVEVVAACLDAAPSTTLPHRIEHCCLTSPSAIELIARSGVVPVPQMPFLRERSPDFSEALGDDRMARLYPLRTWIDAGIRPLHSSDAPVVNDVRPMPSVFAAVTRRDTAGRTWGEEEGITLDEAISMLVEWPAEAEGLQDLRGRIAPGHAADMTVLPQDPFGCELDELEEMDATMTIVGGEVVWAG